MQKGGKDTPEYTAARQHHHDIGRTRGIDYTLDLYGADALILPSETSYASRLAAIAGYPAGTVADASGVSNMFGIDQRSSGFNNVPAILHQITLGNLYSVRARRAPIRVLSRRMSFNALMLSFVKRFEHI